ncbi:MAG TPA: hypothetical protein VLG50_02905 [Candidatus Saccharimonadales bacterium]|nr:hypothetical protein [Candidatus Saccharimonadales bacterium]
MRLLFLFLNFIPTFLCCTIELCPKIVPKEISMQCDNQGYPKPDSLKFLIAMYRMCNASNDDIAVNQRVGGHYSEKLYVASLKKKSYEKPLFFFKISKKNQSTQNLLAIQHGPIGQKFKELDTLNQSYKQNLPVIIWLTHVFMYKNQNGIKKTIEVSPSAQGELLQDILESHDLFAIKKAASSLGKSLAAFHQLFMDYHDSTNPAQWQTICHGDFSIKNSLYNPITNKIYFIDNEGMRKGSLHHDVTTILASLFMFQYLKKNYNTRWPLYLEYCQSFLKGYVQEYPVEKRAALASFIEKSLDNFFDKIVHKRFINNGAVSEKDFDEREFKRIMYSCLRTYKNVS